MALTPLTDPLGVQRAAHLLRRACFGATKQQIDQFAALTPAQAVAILFDNTVPDPPLPVDPLTGQEWITTGETSSENFELEGYLMRWITGQMLSAGIPGNQSLAYAFRERLVFFMHTHFTTKRSVVNSTRALFYQLALFRLYAFDQEDITVPSEDPELPDTIVPKNFKELTKKICVDNAMLVFLDGRFNVKGSPNENFARELLELYAIGRGLEGALPEPEFEGDYINYTETDVQEGARVLSGFQNDDAFGNIDEETGLPRGVVRGGVIASSHDNGTKTLSARLDNATIAPDPELLSGTQPTEESLLDEISQLIEIIYSKEETALYICRKLYRFFVYHEINETIQAGMVKDLADVFVANGFKLQPLLEALFTSREFYEAGSGYLDNAFGSIIKSPMDLVIGFTRTFGTPVPDFNTELDSFYAFNGGVLGAVNDQGMDYLEPYEVAGYPAYHQFPIYHRNWINPNYLANRYNFIVNRLTSGIDMGMGSGSMEQQVDVVEFVRNNFPDNIASNAKALVVEIIRYLLPVSGIVAFDDPNSELTNERLYYFLDRFLDNLDPDPEAAWTTRWQSGDFSDTLRTQLLNLFNALLQSPEYQLM